MLVHTVAIWPNLKLEFCSYIICILYSSDGQNPGINEHPVMEMSMCARRPVPEFWAWAHMLISMCEYKILTNLGMLVNTRFLPDFVFAHH